MISEGLTPPDRLIFDGQIHRFKSGTNGGGPEHNRAGWYVAYMDGIPAGRFGCWRSGVDKAWHADMNDEMTPGERLEHMRRMDEARKLRDAEQAKAHQEAAQAAAAIWERATPADRSHPYLYNKGVAAHGARIAQDGRLLLPLYAPSGELSSLQYIADTGEKRYHTGAQVAGRFWVIGADECARRAFIGEGFATCASIHEATGAPCFVAYSAGNLEATAATARAKLGPEAELVIVADNDESGTGARYAEKAATKHGAKMILVPTTGDANDFARAGGDLAALLNPEPETWLMQADEFSAKPAPIRWLIKGWLQADATMMVHGPSGGGKSFVMLDMAMHLAAGFAAWQGHIVRPCPVIYLAGEGHHGMRARIAAWKAAHGAERLSMWVSRSGCDLDTPVGYNGTSKEIRRLPVKPGLIIVDTLHRFLKGDENKPQDVRAMLDSCARLSAEFGASVVLVHHTGLNPEAQDRGRGSSAWRGALDIEISVTPSKNERPMEVAQRKNKDGELAEPVYVNLKKTPVPGWLDEDGEQVTSATIESADAPGPAPEKRDRKLDAHRATWEKAWWASGAEVIDGKPYLSKSALINKLITDGAKERAAQNAVNAGGYPDRLIGSLLNACIISEVNHGWTLASESDALALVLKKSSG
jgi:phage/plasmid primase-like uncharacterized protein